MDIETFLEELYRELNISSSPEKEGNKVYSLNLGLEFAVILEDLEPGVTLRTNIHTVPEEKKEDLFIYLMKGNFLGQGTGGAVLGMSKDEKFLTLSSYLPYEMNYHSLKEKLEQFANYADFWQSEVATY